MFFQLKKRIMCGAIGKRVKKQPFDFPAAENYTIDGVKDPMVNNSYYFSAHDGEMSVFARLGKRVNADETWLAICLDGKVYSLREESFPAGSAPVKVEKKAEGWTLCYEGVLNDGDEVSLHATFIPKQKPIDFTTNMPAARMATAIANEKWNRDYFNRLQQIGGQCHYEQEGMLEGELTLNGQTCSLCLPCVRDHSFGRRDWNDMNNHLWLMAVSDERQFNYSMVSYPALSVLEVGNYRDEAGMHYMMQADLDLQLVGMGTIPEELALNVGLDNGETLPVKVRKLAGVTYHFQNGQYILHENVAEFEIAGHVCRGILEIGFNRDRSRYFNQRDLRSIRR